MKLNKRVLIIENNNFIDFPTGGTLSFDKHLLKVIPADKVALVGITTGDNKIGQWTKIEIDGKEYDFFPLKKVADVHKKPLIPARLTSLISLFMYMHKIREKENSFIFTQTPQFLFALRFYKWVSVCFCFAGVSNSVSLSRYSFLQLLGSLYERFLFNTLKNNVDVILAAADTKAIEELKARSKGLLNHKNILPFPTRFDNTIFKPLNKNECRDSLKLPHNKTIFVAIGRLCWVKGWDLLIDLMKVNNDKDTILIFVGDGEDREQIENIAHDELESGSIRITGFLAQDEVAQYINASDLVLVGSYHEGWSTSMVESLACGKAIVSSEVSGATELIKDGENGFILLNRDTEKLITLVKNALKLKDASDISVTISKKYSLANLYSDLLIVWPDIE